jgi:type I restriction enzyme S subunit
MTLEEAGVRLHDCLHKTPAEFQDGAYRYIAIPQMVRGHLDFASARRISESDFLEWTLKANPQAHDVVLSRRCNPGETSYVSPGETFALGQNLVLLRADGSSVYPPFLRWLVRGPQWWEQIRTYLNVGAVFDSLKCRDVPRFEFDLPPLREQRAIAGVLGALDDKIEQNRRTVQALERLARAIFRAWFVDFEPVKAKAAGATSFPSMPQPVFDALPTRLVNSEIGPVPEGWDVRSLANCVQLTMGQSPPSEHYNFNGAGLPFHQGVTDYGFRFPSHRVYCTVDSRLAEPRDVLLSVRAPVGRINVADRPLVLGRGLAGLRHPEGRQSFLLYQTFHVFADEDAVGDGTIYKAVTKSFLSQMPLLSPPEEAQAAFEDVAQSLDDLIASHEAESRQLADMRDYLLPKLLNGDVRLEVTSG